MWRLVLCVASVGMCFLSVSSNSESCENNDDKGYDSEIPFKPFPKLPIKEPWIHGTETGLSLNNGNVLVGDFAKVENVPTECPKLDQPIDIHFMVINLDRSKNRRRKMMQAFRDKNLPKFERVPGVIVDKSKMDSYSPPRLGKSLKLADYGCALAHIAAWRRVIAGSHDWVVVMEDDAEFVDDVDLTKMPKVPTDADLVLFREQFCDGSRCVSKQMRCVLIGASEWLHIS
eukprot:m.257524 g.257524  ORF g.257524 m.257524 type:complete len:230 (-) comp16190_c0_seq5:4107-4796(-)